MIMDISEKPHILVIGTASIDRLHLTDKQVYDTIGGAGVYTALAASRVDAKVTLFAPRPTPIPERFEKFDASVRWIGPEVSINKIPRLEIAHYGGGQAELLEANWGAESQLGHNGLPDDLSSYAIIHIAALSSAQRQLDFLRACRRRNANKISVGTYAQLIRNEDATVLTLFKEADLFFMNENEATMLFGSTESLCTERGRILFVTRGERGAVVVEASNISHVLGSSVVELDPTGAGDSFCGTILAELAQNKSAIEAAKEGNQIAAKNIQHIGPAGLF